MILGQKNAEPLSCGAGWEGTSGDGQRWGSFEHRARTDRPAAGSLGHSERLAPWWGAIRLGKILGKTHLLWDTHDGRQTASVYRLQSMGLDVSEPFGLACQPLKSTCQTTGQTSGVAKRSLS